MKIICSKCNKEAHYDVCDIRIIIRCKSCSTISMSSPNRFLSKFDLTKEDLKNALEKSGGENLFHIQSDTVFSEEIHKLKTEKTRIDHKIQLLEELDRLYQ